eukprot:GEMP01057019.1.p1 GENE.GEMP01057019.1~~GEMP01057019.1.p1  ORF type:complete len:417 (+),score=73.96 GEMP01057019.1:34-1284(+)
MKWILAFCASAFSTRLHVANKPANEVQYKQELENFQNSQYYGNLTVGGQRIKGIFDTGSFELLVLSSRCKTCRRHPYDFHLSTTYVKNGTMAKHVFGSGPVVSMQAYEKVQVGLMETDKQVFWEIVDHHIQVLEFAKFSAIVGIGHSYPPTNTENTLLMNYDVEEFSVCLENKDAAPGWLLWGPTMTTAKRDDIMVSVEVVGKMHWGVKMKDVMIGDKKILCGDGHCGAIVDSGTSLIAAPASHLEAIEASGLLDDIKEDCSNLDSLPVLHFTLGEHEFHLPPKAYVMQIKGAVLEADSVWDVLFFKPKLKKVNMCMPAFMQLEKISDYGPVWILGMPFLRYYYTTFNRHTMNLYFARASRTCEPRPFKMKRSFLQDSRKTIRELDDEPEIPMTMNPANLMPPVWDEGDTGEHMTF